MTPPAKTAASQAAEAYVMREVHNLDGDRQLEQRAFVTKGFLAGFAAAQGEIEKRIFVAFKPFDDARRAAEQQIDKVDAEVERLSAELSALKGDREKFLASDDCYYWTPEAQAEKDALKARCERLERALRQVDCLYTNNQQYDPSIAREALKGGANV